MRVIRMLINKEIHTMSNDWKDFEDWKEKLNESKNNRRDDELDFVDDDVEDLTELFKEYID